MQLQVCELYVHPDFDQLSNGLHKIVKSITGVETFWVGPLLSFPVRQKPITHRTDQIDHDLDNLDPNLPL